MRGIWKGVNEEAEREGKRERRDRRVWETNRGRGTSWQIMSKGGNKMREKKTCEKREQAEKTGGHEWIARKKMNGENMQEEKTKKETRDGRREERGKEKRQNRKDERKTKARSGTETWRRRWNGRRKGKESEEREENEGKIKVEEEGRKINER